MHVSKVVNHYVFNERIAFPVAANIISYLLALLKYSWLAGCKIHEFKKQCIRKKQKHLFFTLLKNLHIQYKGLECEYRSVLHLNGTVISTICSTTVSPQLKFMVFRLLSNRSVE